MAKYVKMNYYNGSEYEALYSDYVYNSHQDQTNLVGAGAGLILPDSFINLRSLRFTITFYKLNIGTVYLRLYPSSAPSDIGVRPLAVTIPEYTTISDDNIFFIIGFICNPSMNNNLTLLGMGFYMNDRNKYNIPFYTIVPSYLGYNAIGLFADAQGGTGNVGNVNLFAQYATKGNSN